MDWAIDEVEVDWDGEFAEDVVFKILQTKVGAPVPGKGACFYCGRKGHGWMRCFKL